MKALLFGIIIGLFFVVSAAADHLTCDPQPKIAVTKYRIDLNGETFPAEVENVGEDQVRIYYNIDHLGGGKYVVNAQAGNDAGEWSLPSNTLEFYRGVPTPQNIGLYCITKDPIRIPQENLSLYHFSSQEIVAVNKPAENVIDGNPETFWITDHSLKHPHEIQIDLGRQYIVHGLYALPRQDSSNWGVVKEYEVYISLNGTEWIIAKNGSFPFNKEEQLALFDPVSARYVSLVGLSSHEGTVMSVSEINVLGH